MSGSEHLSPAPDSVQRAALVGAGTIGASWAALLLAQGLSVRIFDPAPNNVDSYVRRYISSAWPDLCRLGLADGAIPERLKICTNLTDCLEGAEFVQESVPEKLELKQAVPPMFVECDRIVAHGYSSM